MRNLIQIILFLFISTNVLPSYGQEIVINDPEAEKSIEDYRLETNDKGYTLFLIGSYGKEGHYIDFVDTDELENFLLKAIEMFEIPIKEYSKKEVSIDWTHEHLKFCSSEEGKQNQKVKMSRWGYSVDKISILSFIEDLDKHDVLWTSGSHSFTKNEIIELYNSVSDNQLPLEVSSNEKADEDKGTVDPYDSSYSGYGSLRLANRTALNKAVPDYPCNEEGRIVVTITVNQSGNVILAEPGAKGTTNSAKCLLKVAKEAALKTTFNADSKAPSKQVGEIIYNFSLSE